MGYPVTMINSRIRIPTRAAMFSIGVICVAIALVERTEASDPITVASNTQGVTLSRGSARNLAATCRATNDLVFIGRFQSARPDTTTRRVLVECRIDEILAGYSADSTVIFTRLFPPSFAADRLQNGTRVFVRITRRCTMTGADCGDLMVIRADGALLSDHVSSNQMEAWKRDPRPLRLRDIPLDVLTEGGLGELIGASEGIACVDLTENPFLPSAGGVWRCSDVTWVIPCRDSMPAYVRFPRIDACYANRPPVRYLIPVPRGFRGGTLSINCCPQVLRVKDGVATGLGVPLSRVQDVIRRRANGRLQLIEPEWMRRSQVRLERR